MRFVRVFLAAVAIVVAIQLTGWAVAGSGGVFYPAIDATRLYFDKMLEHAVRYGWDDGGRLPSSVIILPPENATALGDATMKRWTALVDDYGMRVVLAGSERANFEVWVLDTPFFATVAVGYAGTCTSPFEFDYVNVAGWWVRLPQEVSFFIRETELALEDWFDRLDPRR